MKCKSCKSEFEPMYRNEILISKFCISCLISKGKEKQAEQWRKDKKELKTKLKTHSEWLNDLQKVFNTYIRVRDSGKPCISCDRPLTDKFDAGHFFSVGAYPNIRFDRDNVHGQCVYCNQHLHGATNEYAIRLPSRIGQFRYDALLLRRNNTGKLSITQIKEHIQMYKEMTKQIELKRIDLHEKTEFDKISDLF